MHSIHRHFFIADILTLHRRKSTGVTKNINDGATLATYAVQK